MTASKRSFKTRALFWTSVWWIFDSTAPMIDSSDDTTPTVPLIDISPFVTPSRSEERLAVAKKIGQACVEVGFFGIVNHGVSESVVAEVWDATGKFFDLPLEEKLLSASDDTNRYPYGYEHSESLSKGKALDGSSKPLTSLPDLKETYAVGPDNAASGMPPRQFPPRPPEMKRAYEHYYSAMEDLSKLLLQAFALALDLPERWFEDKMDHHMCALRALNYPSLSIDPLTGQLRAGSHTDYGALTIVKSGGPGLQLTKENEVEQKWVDVPHIRDAFVINIGDLMQRWTNDKWVSTLHRVVVPPGDGRKTRRQSLAFFVNINGDAVVRPIETCVDDAHPPQYDAISAKEHLMSKHLASMGIERSEARNEL